MQMTNELLNPPTELRAKIEHAGDEAATKPTQNAFIESFNARLRVKCVNEHVFRTEHALRGVVLASLSETRVEGGAHPLQDFGAAMEQVHDVGAGEHCTELEGELFGRLLRTELPELGGARRALPEQ